MDSWETRMARRYYAKLFKEYAIADLSRYKVCCCLTVCTARYLRMLGISLWPNHY